MASLLESLGGEFEQLDALLTSLQEVAERLEDQLSTGSVQLEGLAQRVEVSGQQAREGLSEVKLQWTGLAGELRAEATNLAQNAAACSERAFSLKPNFWPSCVKQPPLCNSSVSNCTHR